MTLEEDLRARNASKCELCETSENLLVYRVPPDPNDGLDACVLVCTTCHTQIENPDLTDVHHWRCLNDTMWTQTPAVQVVIWRMLTRLQSENWAQDLRDMLYLKEEVLVWAKALDGGDDVLVKHVDSNGALLEVGDTVTLVKDLNVKGGGFTAKRGTAVRGISLVVDNPEQIEGRVNGQQIVILTKFVKKGN